MPRPRRRRISNEMLNVRRSLGALDRSLRRLVSMLGQLDGRIERRRKPRARSRRTLSPKVHAARVLLGRYMGLMRYLKPRQKAQVRRIREAKGVKAAIQRAREMR